MCSSSSAKCSLENFTTKRSLVLLIENGLTTTILQFIAIISGTIYHPAKVVNFAGWLMTGLALTAVL